MGIALQPAWRIHTRANINAGAITTNTININKLNNQFTKNISFLIYKNLNNPCIIDVDNKIIHIKLINNFIIYMISTSLY